MIENEVIYYELPAKPRPIGEYEIAGGTQQPGEIDADRIGMYLARAYRGTRFWSWIEPDQNARRVLVDEYHQRLARTACSTMSVRTSAIEDEAAYSVEFECEPDTVPGYIAPLLAGLAATSAATERLAAFNHARLEYLSGEPCLELAALIDPWHVLISARSNRPVCATVLGRVVPKYLDAVGFAVLGHLRLPADAPPMIQVRRPPRTDAQVPGRW